MYSFTIGIALQHPKHISQFIRFIEPFTNLISKQIFNSYTFDYFINFISGQIKSSQLTDSSHQSSKLLIKYCQKFKDLFIEYFKNTMSIVHILSKFYRQ